MSDHNQDSASRTSDPSAAAYLLKIYHDRTPVFEASIDQTITEIGRQAKDEPRPYKILKPSSGPVAQRIIIAPMLGVENLSRSHVWLHISPDGRVNVENRSRKVPLHIGKVVLPPVQSTVVDLSTLIVLGNWAFRVEEVTPDEDETVRIVSLSLPPLAPGSAEAVRSIADLVGNTVTGDQDAVVLPWLRRTMNVFQSVANSRDFTMDATNAVLDMISLSNAAVLRLVDNEWKTDARAPLTLQQDSADWRPSDTMLRRVVQEKRTLRQLPNRDRAPDSLKNVNTVVVAPILDVDGNVIGALYGDRQIDSNKQLALITEMEATIVELLASGVAAGLARLEQEAAAARSQSWLEQSFTPTIARQLATDPDMLSGRQMEVTVLFCDIRGFSKLSEQLGPKRTVAWISDVMNELSESIEAHDGVVVDYVGDEVMAMWGAPIEQPDQATLACRAALQMLQKLAQLNSKWKSELGGEFGLGVGINTGPAYVGDVGTSVKLKYGPLGNTVNLGSRTQGLNKMAKTNVLITSATNDQLQSGFRVRRVAAVRVVGIEEPTSVFELSDSTSGEWPTLATHYEKALELFENGQFPDATRILGNLLESHPDDGPTLQLLSRTVNEMADPSEVFEPIWNPLTK